MKLTGKTVVLTGANGGIGSAVAAALAAAGARLLLTGRNAGKLEQIVANLPGSGHRLLVADLAAASGRASLVDQARRESADILINNAGASQLAVLSRLDDSQIERLLAINLLTPIFLCRDFLPLLSERPEAAIVNIGSILGSIGYAGSTAYCASKFGLRGFTEALRREVADTGVRILYLAPRATDTSLNSDEMRALNAELGAAVDTPNAVADHLVYLLRSTGRKNGFIGWPESFFVRLNGLWPNLVDRALQKHLPIIRRHAGGHSH